MRRCGAFAGGVIFWKGRLYGAKNADLFRVFFILTNAAKETILFDVRSHAEPSIFEGKVSLSMTFAKRLCALLPLVYPKFYTIADTFGHEFVLLAKSAGELPSDAPMEIGNP